MLTNLHAVEATTLGSAGDVRSLELVRDANVKVTLVLLVRAVLDPAGNTLLLLNGEDIAQVEHGLLPVSVLGVRTGGEVDGLVAGAELDIEPSDESVDEVAALGSEGVGD